MPWHILPRKSADVKATAAGRQTTGRRSGDRPRHSGAREQGRGRCADLRVLGVGHRAGHAAWRAGRGSAEPDDSRGSRQHLPVTGGPVCSVTPNFVWEFVFNMHERKASPVGTIHEVDIDVNGDRRQ